MRVMLADLSFVTDHPITCKTENSLNNKLTNWATGLIVCTVSMPQKLVGS